MVRSVDIVSRFFKVFEATKTIGRVADDRDALGTWPTTETFGLVTNDLEPSMRDIRTRALVEGRSVHTCIFK